MGIDVSAAKAVSINDQHENGVDTSIDREPTSGKVKGIPTLHVFSRNYRGKRQRDDGNPLIHALKERNDFSITPFWRSQIHRRVDSILAKKLAFIQHFDMCLPIPSTSAFCKDFAISVSTMSGVPLLDSSFLVKKTVGELLAECRAATPKLRPAQRVPYTSQLATWEQVDQDSEYQAKFVDNGIRTLFQSFKQQGLQPNIAGKRVLVIDDIFATGSSLFSVRHVLTNCLGAEVGYLSFMSGNNGR